MTVRRGSTWLAVVLLVLSSPWVVEASVVLPLDLQTLARRAHLVVQGVVQSNTSSWTTDRQQIYTQTRIEVRTAIKGIPPAVVEVQTSGGVVGNIAQKVHGGPSFKTGEEVILFLLQVTEGVFEVDSLSLGKFTVFVDSKGTPMVGQQTTGLRSLGKGGQLQSMQGFPSMTVAELVKQVRQAVSQSKAQP